MHARLLGEWRSILPALSEPVITGPGRKVQCRPGRLAHNFKSADELLPRFIKVFFLGKSGKNLIHPVKLCAGLVSSEVSPGPTSCHGLVSTFGYRLVDSDCESSFDRCHREQTLFQVFHDIEGS